VDVLYEQEALRRVLVRKGLATSVTVVSGKESARAR